MVRPARLRYVLSDEWYNRSLDVEQQHNQNLHGEQLHDKWYDKRLFDQQWHDQLVYEEWPFDECTTAASRMSSGTTLTCMMAALGGVVQPAPFDGSGTTSSPTLSGSPLEWCD